MQTAQPVSGGMGMHLLQKMGWRPGEGLGKNKEGTLEPLKLEVKLDKRGLVTDQDIGHAMMKPGKSKKDAIPIVKTLEGEQFIKLFIVCQILKSSKLCRAIFFQVSIQFLC